MQKIVIVLIALFIISCSDGRNEKMTKLVNEKKTIEDSIKISAALESDYSTKARRNMTDSNLWHALADTSSMYFGVGHKLRVRMEEIDFSIDSLSKMR